MSGSLNGCNLPPFVAKERDGDYVARCSMCRARGRGRTINQARDNLTHGLDPVAVLAGLDFQSELPVNAGMSTCPLCQRRWLVTPAADCLLPACGCFGTDTTASNPHRPCHSCGLSHALACSKTPEIGDPGDTST